MIPPEAADPIASPGLSDGLRDFLKLSPTASVEEALGIIKERLEQTRLNLEKCEKTEASGRKHPSKPGWQKEASKLEGYDLWLRDEQFGPPILELCEQIYTCLEADPPNRARAREFLRRAAKESKKLNEKSELHGHLQKVAATLEGIPPTVNGGTERTEIAPPELPDAITPSPLIPQDFTEPESENTTGKDLTQTPEETSGATDSDPATEGETTTETASADAEDRPQETEVLEAVPVKSQGLKSRGFVVFAAVVLSFFAGAISNAVSEWYRIGGETVQATREEIRRLEKVRREIDDARKANKKEIDDAQASHRKENEAAQAGNKAESSRLAAEKRQAEEEAKKDAVELKTRQDAVELERLRLAAERSAFEEKTKKDAKDLEEARARLVAEKRQAEDKTKTDAEDLKAQHEALARERLRMAEEKRLADEKAKKETDDLKAQVGILTSEKAQLSKLVADSKAKIQPESDPVPPRTVPSFVTNSLGMKFMPVPGSTAWFSVWETRVHDYEAYAEAVSLTAKKWKDVVYENKEERPSHPVVNVSWEDAKKFCAWLTEKEGKGTYRLPTDAEWSLAMGITEGRGTPSEKDEKLKDVYPWGPRWPPPPGAGNYRSSMTRPVGGFAATAQGLFDLGGNVAEWCEDFYDGKAGYRVLRGGSWNSEPRLALSSSRDRKDAANTREAYIGFRCVVTGVSAR